MHLDGLSSLGAIPPAYLRVLVIVAGHEQLEITNSVPPMGPATLGNQ